MIYRTGLQQRRPRSACLFGCSCRCSGKCRRRHLQASFCSSKRRHWSRWSWEFVRLAVLWWRDSFQWFACRSHPSRRRSLLLSRSLSELRGSLSARVDWFPPLKARATSSRTSLAARDDREDSAASHSSKVQGPEVCGSALQLGSFHQTENCRHGRKQLVRLERLSKSTCEGLPPPIESDGQGKAIPSQHTVTVRVRCGVAACPSIAHDDVGLGGRGTQQEDHSQHKAPRCWGGRGSSDSLAPGFLCYCHPQSISTTTSKEPAADLERAVLPSIATDATAWASNSSFRGKRPGKPALMTEPTWHSNRSASPVCSDNEKERASPACK